MREYSYFRHSDCWDIDQYYYFSNKVALIIYDFIENKISKNQEFFLKAGLTIVIGVFFFCNYFINIFVLLLVYTLFFSISSFFSYFIVSRRFGIIFFLFKVPLIFYFYFIYLLLASISFFIY